MTTSTPYSAWGRPFSNVQRQCFFSQVTSDIGQWEKSGARVKGWGERSSKPHPLHSLPSLSPAFAWLTFCGTVHKTIPEAVVSLLFKDGSLDFSGVTFVCSDRYQWPTTPGTIRCTLTQNTRHMGVDHVLVQLPFISVKLTQEKSPCWIVLHVN